MGRESDRKEEEEGKESSRIEPAHLETIFAAVYEDCQLIRPIIFFLRRTLTTPRNSPLLNPRGPRKTPPPTLSPLLSSLLPTLPILPHRHQPPLSLPPLLHPRRVSLRRRPEECQATLLTSRTDPLPLRCRTSSSTFSSTTEDLSLPRQSPLSRCSRVRRTSGDCKPSCTRSGTPTRTRACCLSGRI